MEKKINNLDTIFRYIISHFIDEAKNASNSMGSTFLPTNATSKIG